MLSALVAVIAILASNSGATPAAVTENVLGGHAERVNVAGHFATVLDPHGMLEGTAATAPLLLKRFAFGWQAVESLDFRCRLTVHVRSMRDRMTLLRGMPQPNDDRRECGTVARTDSGPQSDINWLRSHAAEPLIPLVAVAGRYAKVDWYGAGGGEQIYIKRAGRWVFAFGGGGAVGVDDMRHYGIPSSAWCGLQIFDAHCRAPRTRA